MRITIFNGNPHPDNGELDGYLQTLTQQLQAQQHQVELAVLRDLEVKYCTGCFGCWEKTPGECLFPDDSIALRRAAINSGLLILASPVRMGFTSAVLKRVLDKLIPLVHPYLEIDRGEIHHRKRYRQYPLLGLLLAPSADTDPEDIAIIEQSFRRMSINFKTRLAFSFLSSKPCQEVADEINRL